MNELSPDQASEHQASVAQAQQAARELEEVRQKLEEQHKANEEKLKKELEGFLISCVFFSDLPSLKLDQARPFINVISKFLLKAVSLNS